MLAYGTWSVIKETSDIICLLQTYCHLSIIEKLFVSWQCFETDGVIDYGSGGRKDVVKHCLEFGTECMILEFGTECVILGVWHGVCDLGVWHGVCDPWSLARSVWSLEFGTECVILVGSGCLRYVPASGVGNHSGTQAACSLGLFTVKVPLLQKHIINRKRYPSATCGEVPPTGVRIELAWQRDSAPTGFPQGKRLQLCMGQLKCSNKE